MEGQHICSGFSQTPQVLRTAALQTQGLPQEAEHSLTSSKGPPALSGSFPRSPATKPATLPTSLTSCTFVDLGITSDCLWLYARKIHFS